jgi:hypothetical protein
LSIAAGWRHPAAGALSTVGRKKNGGTMANTVVEHVATGKRQVAWFDVETDDLRGYAAKSPLTGAWLVGSPVGIERSVRLVANGVRLGRAGTLRDARYLVCGGNGRQTGGHSENASVMYDSDRPSHVLTTV